MFILSLSLSLSLSLLSLSLALSISHMFRFTPKFFLRVFKEKMNENMPIYILITCTNMIIKKYNIVTLSLFLQPTYLI